VLRTAVIYSFSKPVIPSGGEPADVFDRKIYSNRSRGTWFA
jgi:hypothetical protein